MSEESEGGGASEEEVPPPPPPPKRARLTREEEAARRQANKEDTTASNLRNRLLRRFGEDKVKKNDGTLPSESKKQVEMLITCFERMRGLEDGKGVETRTRVVTVGLSTVLPRDDIRCVARCSLDLLLGACATR